MIRKNTTLNFCRLFALLAVLLTAGCVRSDIDGPTDREGDPTECFIRMLDPGLTPVSRGIELTPEKERFIKSLFVFVFDQDGGLVSSTEHIDVTLHKQPGGYDESWDPVAIHAIVGNGRKIYAVANYNSQVVENIKSVSSLDDLKNLIVQNLGNPLSQDQGLIKVGVLENVNIRSGMTYTLDMVNLVSKITINVVNKCADLDISGWTIDGFALKSYVVERAFDPNNLNYNDAPDINNSADFYNNFSDQSFDFPTVDDQTDIKTYSVTGYCYENRRGGRVDRDAPPVGWPNGNENSGSRKETQLKSWYAPTNATRVRIYGRVRSESKTLTINHYLGENNHNDYNVCRGKHYIYTITINSLNNIDIDTNIEQNSDLLSVHTSPDLDNIDAHASMRMFQIHTNELHAGSGTVDFEVLSNMSSDTERPDWLKVAIFPLVTYQVKAGSADETNGIPIGAWQQDGVPEHYYTRTKFIPHQSVRQKLTRYAPPAGITLGTDAYPTDDDVLPYLKAIHRMCYKITDLPIPADYLPTTNEPTSMFVYADEFTYDPSPTATDYREAVVRVTYTPTNGLPQYYYYTLRQYRPTIFRGLPGETSAMLVERTEDFRSLLQTSLLLELQTLGGLQWGPSVSSETDYSSSTDDGRLNTAQAVYKTVTGSGSTTSWATDYSNERTKYGSNTGGWTGTNGAIVQPATATLSGQPFFLYNLQGMDYYNSIFNTTATRYCHEKNFDTNGDGVISPKETVWYLPSEQELQLMWTYNEILGLDPVFYWSSTLPADGSSDKAVAISMRRSPADVGTVYNGVPQGRARSGYSGTSTPPRVRCVRRISTTDLINGNKVTPLGPIVTQSIDGSAVIDCASLSGDIYTSTSKLGISQKNVGELQNANTKIYKKFEVQRTQNAPETYTDLYHGTGKCDESTGWRMPTQRELLLIWSVKDRLEALSGFTKFLNEPYWTMQRSNTENYLIDFSTGLAVCHKPQDHKHQYRCIREL